MLKQSVALSLASLLLVLPTVIADTPEERFEKQVRPLLVQHCIACHGPDKQKAGLRLDSKAAWQVGGERGAAIKPGNPDASLIIKALHAKDGLEQMPPKAPLTAKDIATLTKWVQDGAFDPRDGGGAKLGGMTLHDAKNWWSFRPVKRLPVPSSDFTHPIDAFITQKLQQKGLALSPMADRHTLIRRVTYDLIGLPPTPDEMDAFIKDTSPNAYAKVVDRLLASPHYGERWGRHWLDLVRYADTAGENSDHPLPHAWRYRNWVINAVNRDQPYDEFVRDQLAGDILATKGPEDQYSQRLTATGYLAMARRFDHDSDQSMHLTHEDGIDTLGKAFLGITLGCARCHDHKYDAVTARDYYALYGIFESTKFAFPGCEAKQQPRDMVPLLPPAEWARVVKPYQEHLAKITQEIATLEAKQAQVAKQAQDLFAQHRNRLSQGEIPDGGDQTFATNQEVEVRVGEMVFLSITPLKNHGADTTFLEFEIAEVDGMKRKWNATADLLSDFLNGNPHADRYGNPHTWWMIDARHQPTPLSEAVRDVNGKPGLLAWRNSDTPSVVVNNTTADITAWTQLPARSLFVHPAPNGNVAVAWLSPIAGKVTVKGRVKDAHSGGPDGIGWVLEHFAVDVRTPFLAQLDAAKQKQAALSTKAELVKTAPRQDVAYAVVEGKPADTHLQLRGDPEKKGEVVPRRWLEVLGGTLVKNKSASGRLELAGWIASRDNPLFARVMVNRIWLHHFGKGIVKTPNDFGTRGSPPTHPELLDWLAAEFVKSGWSLKAMHRLMVLSATYQQSDLHRDDAMKVDPLNDLYWRFDRRRLSAEEIRDSLLVASGQLDRQPAQAHPFPPESAWSYTQHVPFSTFFETNKRSVYLVQVRNRRHPFLGLFDGADPNATTPIRQTTTVPTQALYFLNDPFFHSQAEKVSDRVLAKPTNERLTELFRIVFQRAPTAKETEFATQFLKQYTQATASPAASDKLAWAAFTRVLLASNEFLFVE